MTKSRSDAAIIREVSSMNPETITDAYALDLHIRHITSAGQLPESVRARRGAITRLADHLDPYAENPRAVLEATSEQLAEWQASKSHLSAKSISVYVGHLHMYYRWLVRPMRIIRESPAEDLMVPIVRRRTPRPIPEEDLEFALTACTGRQLYAWLVLGAYAGLRSVDIAGLDRGDVLTGQDVPMLRIRGKGDHENLIPVGDEVIRALGPFLGRRAGGMFVDDQGRRLTRHQIRERANDFLARIGLPYTFHQLRHRYGTRVYEITRDLRYTQRALRHESIRSTEIYVAVPTAQDASTMQALDADLAKRARRDLSA